MRRPQASASSCDGRSSLHGLREAVSLGRLHDVPEDAGQARREETVASKTTPHAVMKCFKGGRVPRTRHP